MPSQPQGGRRRAVSAGFPEREQVNPDLRMLGASRRVTLAGIPTCGVNLRASCCEKMGAAVTRAIRNVNLENRAEREISKMKPSPAPRHPTTKSHLRDQMSSHPDIKNEIDRKDDKLLSLLKAVYVDSKDPMSSVQVEDAGTRPEPKEFRLPKGHHFDLNIENIPKGKISTVEALTLLNNHKLHPETWTAEKIAEEYHLEQKDVNSLLKYFVTFEVQVFPPRDKKAIQSK